MSGSVNKVILIGNLGKDPEVKYLEGGTAVANFSIATSETYKNKNGGLTTSTEWHNIVVWKKLAEITEKYLKKGNKVYIEGKMRTRSWEDQDGNTRYSTEVVADNLTMLGGKNDNTDSSNSKPEANNSVEKPKTDFAAGKEEDDLPF
ncbi:MAG: single-strand DNA-binding protein [Parvicellaceae bacterium]|jgi:single-strand DNA-binding protein